MCKIGAMSDDEELETDPCRAEDTSSGPRTFAFVLMFFSMFGCGVFVAFADSVYWILLASVVGYTAAVMLYGFARNRNGIQSFLFTCPVVVSQYPRLLKRHVLFLAILMGIATVAVRNKPIHSESQPTSHEKQESPYFFFVAIPVAVLALSEIFTNRAMLERAHSERFGDPPDDDASNEDKALSITQRD